MDWDALIRTELDEMVPYAPGLRVSEVRAQSGKENILKLSSNEYPAGPVKSARRAMKAVIKHSNRYPDGSARALREALCAKLGIQPECLAIGNGSNELIRLIAQAVLRPGDEVVFAWPSFVVYPMVTQMFGATAVRVPLNEDQVHDLDTMLAAVTDKTRLMFLCSPNNPTGSIYHRIAFERFLAKVPEHVLVVVDEAYFEFVTDDMYPDALSYFDGKRPLVSLRTFSKIYSLAGCRIGYGIMPEQLRLALDKLREPFNVNTVAQIGAFYSLAEESEVERRKQENQEQKTYLYECFDRLGIQYVPSQTNFVYFMTEKPVEVFQALLEEGVIVRDFGTAPALRVGVGTPEDTVVTIAAFDAVAEKLGTF
ncbi:MAG: histidinol-phosphate transaminase [Actinobacteria bacterium]|nr:histidinol-phosphate transaminase [Actinomycetota bacterium]MCG2807735.1 histidinol-phosphate transaminase [Coriobacteriia bacterium]